ncbi:hypothetical protein BH09PAT4_BH09PAT4_08690 [soil metagenome]
MHSSNKIVQKLFADKHGRIILVQKPNAPLLLWATCMVANWLVTAKGASTILHITGTLGLSLWALLEIGWGVSYIRRLLGIVVLVWIIAGLFW